jgi:RNA polymerase sigma factor (sigma-70 family)
MKKVLDYDLFVEYSKTKDKKVKDEIILKYMQFVKSIAKKFHIEGGFTKDDFVAEGVMGLSRAIERFDVKKEVGFIHYATFWVTQAMYSFFYYNFKTVRIPKVIFVEYRKMEKEIKDNLEGLNNKYEFTQYSLDFNDNIGESGDDKLFKNTYQTLASDDISQIDKSMQVDRREYLMNVMQKSLFPREYFVITRFYGLFDTEKKTITDLSSDLYISRQRTQQILNLAMMKVKRKLKQNKYLGDDLF